MTTADTDRRAELARNLAEVRARVETALSVAGRGPGEVTLIVVTKTWPASDVVHLVGLGVTDVGENRDQEAAPKAAQVAAALGAGVPGTPAGPGPRWHFVGQLQRNKCRSVVGYADVVQSVDGVHLAETLAGAAVRHRVSEGDAARPLDVLVQVSIDGDPARGGAMVPDGSGGVPGDRDLWRVLARVAELDGLALRGVMAVAPLEWTPDRAYATLASIVDRVRREHPDAGVLSAGMSGDFEYAINYGATHVRVGSAVLGNRPSLM
jgi:pyridoxal phosphate enzyme (YggS family)